LEKAASHASGHEAEQPLILVVDDEPFIRMMATDYIEDLGCRALEAENSAHALRMLAEHGPVDVLFTDINMPGEMDGLTLAACVHQLHPKVEIIVTSGKRMIADEALPDHGTFLRKPYAYNELRQMLSLKVGEL
jgi:two-component system, response regulator PdtaR